MKISPFSPELGRIPTYIIERDIFPKFVEMLPSAAKGKPKNCLLIGGRGYGKTVALKVLSEIAKADGFIPVRLDCNETIASPEKLSKALYERTYDSLVELVTRVKMLEVIKKYVPLPKEISFGGARIELEKKETRIDQYNISRNLSALLKKRKVVFLFDETQSVLSKGIARFLVNLFYSELPEKIENFITVLCGAPILTTDILEATPAFRAFPEFRLERFSAPKTRELLQETVKDSPVRFPDNVCELIYRDTLGHPYYTHYWGDFLFLKKEAGEITTKFYLSAKQALVRKFGENVLEKVLESLERKGKYREIFEAIARTTRSDKPTIPKLAKKYTPGVRVYIQRLYRMGYLTQVKRGVYAPEDSLLAKYVLKKKL